MFRDLSGLSDYERLTIQHQARKRGRAPAPAEETPQQAFTDYAEQLAAQPNPANPKRKRDFDRAAKLAFIGARGYAAWAKLPD